MRFEPIIPDTLVLPEQKAVVQSCFTLRGQLQKEWAKENGFSPVTVSRMLNGRWAVTEDVAAAFNRLVRETHPVRLSVKAA